MLDVVEEHGGETFLNHSKPPSASCFECSDVCDFSSEVGRIKLEQAEATAKMAEKSKAAAEKKLKTTEQDFLTSLNICIFVFHFRI